MPPGSGLTLAGRSNLVSFPPLQSLGLVLQGRIPVAQGGVRAFGAGLGEVLLGAVPEDPRPFRNVAWERTRSLPLGKGVRRKACEKRSRLEGKWRKLQGWGRLL